MAELEGQQLGNYRLSRLLGQGGFADVYLGEHIHLGTQAAIKVLRTRVTPENAAQFLNEAKIIAHLTHPNIIRVLEFGVENGMPFLVMDYALNGTMRQRHPKGTQLPLALVVPYVQQAADALQYAHDQKVIHRDLKPENMLSGKRGEVLLSDFGLALTTQSSRYNSTQDVVGTVAYMAPEQLQGKPGPASDQYALGIVIYEWLAGERPFQGSFMEIFAQHMTAQPPSLCAKLPGLPIYVEQAIFLALAKNPAERFQSVQAFANALTNASKAMDRTSGEATVRNVQTPPPSSPVHQPVPPSFIPSPTPAPASQQPFVPSPTPAPASQPPLAIDALSTRLMPDQNRTPAPGGLPTPQPGYTPNQLAQGVATPQQPIFLPPTPVQERHVSADSANLLTQAPPKPTRKRNGKLIALVAAILLVVLFGALVVPRLNLPLLSLGAHPTGTSTTGATAGTTPANQATQGVTPADTATSPASTATVGSASTPTPIGTAPSSGQMLYQANWSKDLDGWLGSTQWKQINNGTLGSDGTGDASHGFIIWSPAHLTTANYKVIAQIQFVRSTNQNGGDFELGIMARGDGNQSGYEAGLLATYCYDRKTQAIISSIADATSPPSTDCLHPPSLVSQIYPVDTNYHTYEFDITGNTLTLFIDGRQIAQTTDNSYIAAGQVGLRDVLGDINVKSFAVYAI